MTGGMGFQPVSFGEEVGLGDDEDDGFAGVDYLAGYGLVEFGVGLSAVDEEAADVGFFDGGEGAKGGKFLDADFAATLAAEAGGVEDFEILAFVFEFYSVDVASCALLAGDYGLLFFAESVEEGGFADVGAADEGYFEWNVGMCPFGGIIDWILG